MLVSRGATFLTICLLIAFSGVDAVNQRHRAAGRAPPAAQFKEQAKTDVSSEAAVAADLAKSQQALEHENKLLSMQQEEAELMVKLKSTMELRLRKEQEVVHNNLLMHHMEVARLVADLSSTSKNKMLIDLHRLNDVIAHALLPHTMSAAHPSSITIEQKFKQTPAASSSSSSSSSSSTNSATPTNGVESDAKKQLHKALVAKATEVVDAQLDSILNSEELAYIKAHNDLGDTDQSQSQDGDIVEQDTGALPGETPDQHFNRLNKEADALMAKAYPFIKCEGDAASASGGTGGGSGGTGHTGSSTLEGSSTGGGNSTATGTAGTGATGSTGESTGATGTGLLEAGATAGSGGTGATGAAGETGAAAAGATAAAAGTTGSTGSSSTGQ